jgi:hypothetical protein
LVNLCDHRINVGLFDENMEDVDQE